mmetsp:Transcript_27861/g.66187  ORF Transcript_27861/g.66187 Transcript_27861/m.66187 type:complete len:238 (+) Transcript_27861:2581-3294(+)
MNHDLLDIALEALTGTAPRFPTLASIGGGDGVGGYDRFLFDDSRTKHFTLFDLDPTEDRFAATIRSGSFAFAAWIAAEGVSEASVLSVYSAADPDSAGAKRLVLPADGGLRLEHGGGGGVAESPYARGTAPSSLSSSLWKHVVVSADADAGVLTLYVDGSEVPAASGGVVPAWDGVGYGMRTTGEHMFVGDDNQHGGDDTTPSGTRAFQGSMRDIRLYSQPRSGTRRPRASPRLPRR